MRLILKLVDFAQSRLSPIMWVGLIQSVGRLNRTNLMSLKQGGILPADGFLAGITTLNPSWVSSMLALLVDFELASLYNHMSQFLKINIPLSYTHTIFKFLIEVQLTYNTKLFSDV